MEGYPHLLRLQKNVIYGEVFNDGTHSNWAEGRLQT